MQRSCGISFLGDLSVRATAELAVQAEALGVEALWMSETYFERDAWSALTAIALATERVTLGTGVVPVYMRHPALLAMSFATLDEVTGGRMIAGIGTGVPNVVAGQLGYSYRSPLSAMRDAITIMSGLFAGETVDVEGRVFSAREVSLEGVPVQRKVPIHAAAVGPKMVALVTEIADGVHFAMRTPDQIASGLSLVREAAERCGRGYEQIDTVVWTIAAVHEEPQVARDVAREHIAVALSAAIGEAQLDQAGLDPAIAGVLRRALRDAGMPAAVREISDEVVDMFSVAGTEAQVIEKVEAMFDAGVKHPVLTAYGKHADKVLPVAARFGARSGFTET